MADTMTFEVGDKVRHRYWDWKAGTVLQVLDDDDYDWEPSFIGRRGPWTGKVVVGVWRMDRSTKRTTEWGGTTGKMVPRLILADPADIVVVQDRKVTSPKFGARECAALYKRADEAGQAAAKAVVPAPMVVYTPKDTLASLMGLPDGGPDPSQPIYNVPEGVCGFAWVTVRPGNCSFALWLKRTKGASKGYYGGMELWVSGYGQSMTRKEAYASAFAGVLRDAGIDASAGSRMD